jgi:hypothetical protein
MAIPEKNIKTYHDLASAYDAQGQAQVRDRYLVLAADAALAAGRAAEADAFLARLLQVNPHHLLKPFASLAQALQSVDVKTYIEGLRRRYPPEHAEETLRTLRPEGVAPSASAKVETPPPPIDPFAQLDETRDWDDAKLVPVEPPPPRPSPPKATPPPPPPPKVSKPATVPEAPIPFAPEAAPAAAPKPARAPTKAASAPSPEEDAEEPDVRNPLASALFYVVLAASIGLGVYTLLRPWLGD